MSAPELTGDDLTAELLDGYVQRGLVESGEHDPAMRLLLAVHLLTEATELLAAHNAEVARQAEARAWDEGAEAVYWWAEDEVNDLRGAVAPGKFGGDEMVDHSFLIGHRCSPYEAR